MLQNQLKLEGTKLGIRNESLECAMPNDSLVKSLALSLLPLVFHIHRVFREEREIFQDANLELNIRKNIRVLTGYACTYQVKI